uniref:Uncharacterized protein n=1 Tax=Anguilla anguilla TaxID=7936 RepID=A0A0E9SEW1_ANGAN
MLEHLLHSDPILSKLNPDFLHMQFKSYLDKSDPYRLLSLDYKNEI